MLPLTRSRARSRFFSSLATAWTPAALGAALALWLDAADSGTITLHGSHHVSQWNDKSGNARHVSQATAAKQPQYEATGLNGKPALNNLAGRFLASGATSVLRNVNGATLVAVAKFTTPLTGANPNGPLLFVNSGLTVGSTRLMLNAGTAGTYSVAGRRLDEDAFTNVISPTAMTANPVIWTGNADYANARVNTWLNGVADIVNATFLTPGNTSDTDSLGLGVLAQNANVFTYNNTLISEALIIRGNLSTDDRQKLEGYLAWKWGGI